MIRLLSAMCALLGSAAYAANPVTELNWAVDPDYSRYPCDVTITAGSSLSPANNNANDVVCFGNGQHGLLQLTDGGSAGTSRSISAVTLGNPVQLDFTASHGWTTGDVIWCDDTVGGTWQLRWRYFKVTVVDADSVTLDGQDGSGAGTRPLWDTFTSGGSCNAPNWKVLRRSTDPGMHVSLLTEASKARISQIEIASGLTHVMILGISNNHDGLESALPTSFGNPLHFRALGGTDWMLVSNFEWYDQDIVDASDPTADTSAQMFWLSGGGGAVTSHVHLEDMVCQDGGWGDSEKLFLNLGSSDSIAVRMVNSEFKNCKPGQVLQVGDHDAITYAGNSSWTATDYLTDCAGNAVAAFGAGTYGAADSSPCRVDEAVFGFKGVFSSARLAAVTGANRHRLPIIDSSIQCCSRAEDMTPGIGNTSDGPSGGMSFSWSNHLSSKSSVLFRNNVAIANEEGVPSGPQACHTDPGDGINTDFLSIVGNVSADHTEDNWAWFTCSEDKYGDAEAMFNTVRDTAGWLSRTSQVVDVTIECNLFVDAGDRSGGAGTGYVQRNNRGYGNTVDMDGGGDSHGGAVSNANMANLSLNPMLHLDSAFSYSLTGVLATISSPFLSACPGFGTANRGVTDAQVTF